MILRESIGNPETLLSSPFGVQGFKEWFKMCLQICCFKFPAYPWFDVLNFYIHLLK